MTVSSEQAGAVVTMLSDQGGGDNVITESQPADGDNVIRTGS